MYRHRYGDARWLQGACRCMVAHSRAVGSTLCRHQSLPRLLCCARHCRSWHDGQQGQLMQMCMSTFISCRNCACQHAHFTVDMLNLDIIACQYTSVPISNVNMHTMQTSKYARIHCYMYLSANIACQPAFACEHANMYEFIATSQVVELWCTIAVAGAEAAVLH